MGLKSTEWGKAYFLAVFRIDHKHIELLTESQSSAIFGAITLERSSSSSLDPRLCVCSMRGMDRVSSKASSSPNILKYSHLRLLLYMWVVQKWAKLKTCFSQGLLRITSTLDTFLYMGLLLEFYNALGKEVLNSYSSSGKLGLYVTIYRIHI